MIQTFFGILALVAIALFAFGVGVAEEIRTPTKHPEKVKWSDMRTFCFWGMILMMILAGLLLGNK